MNNNEQQPQNIHPAFIVCGVITGIIVLAGAISLVVYSQIPGPESNSGPASDENATLPPCVGITYQIKGYDRAICNTNNYLITTNNTLSYSISRSCNTPVPTFNYFINHVPNVFETFITKYSIIKTADCYDKTSSFTGLYLCTKDYNTGACLKLLSAREDGIIFSHASNYTFVLDGSADSALGVYPDNVIVLGRCALDQPLTMFGTHYVSPIGGCLLNHMLIGMYNLSICD